MSEKIKEKLEAGQVVKISGIPVVLTQPVIIETTKENRKLFEGDLKVTDFSVEDHKAGKDAYVELDNAVKDLLCELRINKNELKAMAGGYSPNYPGGLENKPFCIDSNCKVQISKVVAEKLVNTLDL